MGSRIFAFRGGDTALGVAPCPLPALTVTGVHQLAAVRRRRVRRTQRRQSEKHTSTLLLSFERGVAAVVGGGGDGGVAMHPLSGTQPA